MSVEQLITILHKTVFDLKALPCYRDNEQAISNFVCDEANLNIVSGLPPPLIDAAVQAVLQVHRLPPC